MPQDLNIHERKKVAELYVELATANGYGKSQMKAEIEAYRYEHCGCIFRVKQCEDCHTNYRFKSSCNSRICEKCGYRLRHSVQKRFYKLVQPCWSKREKTYGMKFLTLTFNTNRWDNKYPTQSDFKRCQKEVRELVVRFYHKYKAKKSKNGGWYLTTKYRGAGAIGVPEMGKGSNVHFHLLVYGPYIPLDDLIEAWKEITGDSWHVNIQKIQNLKKAVEYVLKYITKPPQTDSYRDVAFWAWLIKGSRRLVTYGIFYNKLPIKVKRDEKLHELCVFDGGNLRYRGESFDKKNILLDWFQYLKYVDDKSSPNLKSYMELTPFGRNNKQFVLN